MTEITSSEPEITEVNEPLLSPPHATVPLPSFYEVDTDGASPHATIATPSARDRTLRMLLVLFARRRGASMVVRHNVARQLEDWREDWGFTLPVVVIETLWSLAFVVVSFATVFWFAREEKNLKLRVWICGYAIQCVVNLVLLLMEYRKRIRRVETYPWRLRSSGSSSENDADHVTPRIRCERVNKVISYTWWPIGFICVISSYIYNGSAPLLFWLTLTFLAMDVFFAAIRFLFLCLLVVTCCLCLPCIIAFLCYISYEGPAPEANIRRLPRYNIRVSDGDVEQPNVRTCRMIPKGTNGPESKTQHFLQTVDAECCICLCHYADGEQLHLLPCNHHFHSKCILKWLRLKANCPLCKLFVMPHEKD